MYRADINLKGHPRIIETIDLLSDAQRWIEDNENALRNGGYVGNAPPGDMLFDDALDRYMAEVSSQKAKSTHRRKLYQARRIIDLTETKTDPRRVPLTVPG